MPALIDLSGRRYGMLRVMCRANKKGPKPRWLCRCDCGEMSTVRGSDLQQTKQTSCGCRKDALTAERSHRHGSAIRGRLSLEYQTWQNMKARCYDRQRPDFHYYGGRGIYVCDEWRDDFTAFLRDMGKRPSPLLTLDRIDVDGPYCASNCQWATRSQQAQNRRFVIASRNI